MVETNQKLKSSPESFNRNQKLNWNSITNTGIVSEIINRNQYQIENEQIE